jgi:hypothetical protein
MPRISLEAAFEPHSLAHDRSNPFDQRLFPLFPKRVGDCLIEKSENGCHGEAAVATTSGMEMSAIADPYGE